MDINIQITNIQLYTTLAKIKCQPQIAYTSMKPSYPFMLATDGFTNA